MGLSVGELVQTWEMGALGAFEPSRVYTNFEDNNDARGTVSTSFLCETAGLTEFAMTAGTDSNGTFYTTSHNHRQTFLSGLLS